VDWCTICLQKLGCGLVYHLLIKLCCGLVYHLFIQQLRDLPGGRVHGAPGIDNLTPPRFLQTKDKVEDKTIMKLKIVAAPVPRRPQST